MRRKRHENVMSIVMGSDLDEPLSYAKSIDFSFHLARKSGMS